MLPAILEIAETIMRSLYPQRYGHSSATASLKQNIRPAVERVLKTLRASQSERVILSVPYVDAWGSPEHQ